ncbi:MAG: acetylornithine carbamoyltransferase [Bacteroidia bacterium]|nr:acetylornithine carbamoyltransferase [Bacteroidia bacterium]
MKHFTTVHDVEDPALLVRESLAMKMDPSLASYAGSGKTLGLIFLNPSLRTRISTQKAAQMLGMNCMVMNMDREGWALEFNDHVVMNGSSVEHIKDAAGVLGQYFDVLGVRCFPGLKNKDEDYSEKVLLRFMKYSSVPVISLESATLHPLQSLADMITIEENKPKNRKPKVVLTWAPHIKALPQAVANSFAEWSLAMKHQLVITHPAGMELCEDFTRGAVIEHDQEKALENADFVYVKNWSGYTDYGKVFEGGQDWMLNEQKMALTNEARVMHCLPVRRNLEVPDEILDAPFSLTSAQAGNRLWSAMAVLNRLCGNKVQWPVESEKETVTA